MSEALTHSPQSPGPQATRVAVPDGLRVLYADDALLVFDKPAGLLAVPGRGPDKQDCLSARAQVAYPDALVVHRLDMATSGIVLMSRGLASQRFLSLCFEQRRTHKRYEAVVAGNLANPQPGNGWNPIDLPLIVDWLARPRSIVSHENGKPSLTHWRLADTPPPGPGTTRLDLHPVTGRSHQLRVHLQAIGHPIVGDPLYASPEQQALSERLLLHARSLEIEHPLTGAMMRFEAPCPF